MTAKSSTHKSPVAFMTLHETAGEARSDRSAQSILPPSRVFTGNIFMRNSAAFIPAADTSRRSAKITQRRRFTSGPKGRLYFFSVRQRLLRSDIKAYPKRCQSHCAHPPMHDAEHDYMPRLVHAHGGKQFKEQHLSVKDKHGAEYCCRPK